MYYQRLLEAQQLAKKLGLETPPIISPTEHLWCDGELFQRIAPYLTITDPHELVAKCNIVSQITAEVIEQQLPCRAYLTIGDVYIDGEPNFRCDSAHLESVTAKGKHSLTPTMYRHHAWITLDSMEIIDFTFNTSLAMVDDKEADPINLSNFSWT